MRQAKSDQWPSSSPTLPPTHSSPQLFALTFITRRTSHILPHWPVNEQWQLIYTPCLRCILSGYNFYNLYNTTRPYFTLLLRVILKFEYLARVRRFRLAEKMNQWNKSSELGKGKGKKKRDADAVEERKVIGYKMQVRIRLFSLEARTSSKWKKKEIWRSFISCGYENTFEV